MKKKVVVSDKMQQEYVYYRTEPAGKSFAPDFKAELTPKKMLELGIFGGRYMRDCRDEFPEDWFENAEFHPQGEPGHSPELNYFGVDASQPLSVWRKKGWIYEEDPRGWFQWYCRYFMGRRIEQEDKRQIGRWRAFKRHKGAVEKNCAPEDMSCRKKQRQALLHWAYDSRKI